MIDNGTTVWLTRMEQKKLRARIKNLFKPGYPGVIEPVWDGPREVYGLEDTVDGLPVSGIWKTLK